jgi:hypothetical protein
MHLDGRFWPVSVLQTCLVESLLWQLHGEGLSWAVSGLFRGYLSGGSKQVIFAGLFMSIYEKAVSDMARRVLKYWTL